MPEETYRHIFVKKLLYYMNKHGKNQMDLMNDLNLSSSTVSSWCTGKKLPRMGKIQLLADYFGIEKSDLIEEKSHNGQEPHPSCYDTPDTRDIAQFLFENPEYKVLFDASRKVKKEDIAFVKEMIDRVSGGTVSCTSAQG